MFEFQCITELYSEMWLTPPLKPRFPGLTAPRPPSCGLPVHFFSQRTPECYHPEPLLTCVFCSRTARFDSRGARTGRLLHSTWVEESGCGVQRQPRGLCRLGLRKSAYRWSACAAPLPSTHSSDVTEPAGPARFMPPHHFVVCLNGSCSCRQDGQGFKPRPV